MSSFESKIRKRLKKRLNVNSNNKVHIISEDMFEQFKLMLKSSSEEDITLAVNVIDQSLFNDEQISYLIKNASTVIWSKLNDIDLDKIKKENKSKHARKNK